MVDARKSFQPARQIAQGGGGTIFLANALIDAIATHGPTLVVKTIGKGMGKELHELGEREQISFRQEVSIMHLYREEKYIAKLLGWSDSPACILMKFYPLGALDKWIDGNSYKSKGYLIRFMCDISRGTLLLHRAGLVHCDLKPQNVLLDTDEQGRIFCCLTDFGITQIVNDTSLLVKDFLISKARGLSVHYAAPEALQRFRSNAMDGVPAERMMKLDLYSLGVIINELIERRPPWCTV